MTMKKTKKQCKEINYRKGGNGKTRGNYGKEDWTQRIKRKEQKEEDQGKNEEILKKKRRNVRK